MKTRTYGIAFMLGALAVGCGSPEDSPASITAIQPTLPATSAEDSGEVGNQEPIVDAGAVDSGAESIFTWKPNAKGLWIWYFDYAGLNAAQIATRAKEVGVGYVLIKSAQNGKPFPDFTEDSVREFTSRGIKVFGWPYITPEGSKAAIATAIESMKIPGVDGLILDVEIEWEKADYSAEAKALCEGIRAGAPGKFLGYTSFGWIGYHPGVPFKTFDHYCGDGAFPQVYFADRGVSWDGPKGLSQAVDMYKAAGLKAPMWPIFSNDMIYGSTARPTTEALNGAFDKGGPYSSLWELPTKESPEALAQLSLLHWKN